MARHSVRIDSTRRDGGRLPHRERIDEGSRVPGRGVRPVNVGRDEMLGCLVLCLVSFFELSGLIVCVAIGLDFGLVWGLVAYAVFFLVQLAAALIVFKITEEER